MIITDQSVNVLSGIDIETQIELCGRTAYKSEDKIVGKESAIAFCQKMGRLGHRPVFDMGCIHILMTISDVAARALYESQNWSEGRYLFLSKIPENPQGQYVTFLLSGSPRAFCEYINNRIIYNFYCELGSILYQKHPAIFELLPDKVKQWKPVFSYSFKQIEEIPTTKLNELLYTKIIDRHTYMLHKHLCIQFTTNRAISHELVRHRPCGVLQESQRYCRYANDKFGNEVTFIAPTTFFDAKGEEYAIWKKSCEQSEKAYMKLLELGASPQAARTVLPNSCKTEINIFTNLIEWEHILRLRAVNPAAEPSMIKLMKLALPEIHKALPTTFKFDLDTKPYH
jgi:thymidylate synthase (FAD)